MTTHSLMRSVRSGSTTRTIGFEGSAGSANKWSTPAPSEKIASRLGRFVSAPGGWRQESAYRIAPRSNGSSNVATEWDGSSVSSRLRQDVASQPETASRMLMGRRRCVRSPGRRARAAPRQGGRRREGAARRPRPRRGCAHERGRAAPSAPTSAPIGASSVKPTAGSIASAARARPPPSSTTASPTARTSIPTTKPRPSGIASTRTGARGRRTCARDTKFFGPPSAATMRSKRSAAAPESSARSSAAAPASASLASPDSASSSAPSAIVTR